MSIKVRVPTPLQKLTRDLDTVECNAKTIKDLVESLDKDYPGLKGRICDENGKIRRFLNIYVNDEDIRFLEMDRTELKDGDEVSIIPAIAGGQAVTFVSAFLFLSPPHPALSPFGGEEKGEGGNSIIWTAMIRHTNYSKEGKKNEAIR
ncbi:MAG: hypothetical protein A3K16_02955 [Omnitrophica bacterium RIFCSPLOWO2_01_FULL_45_24]|nr:MAG: hypothetical protein A3C51_03440 [Omnitrophica bacterium RIFCSPHIGHO2_02_FULL_46_20]OGW94561.1 MAG: hypothetical protein A3K16_02955 [Omnitrophica bacterium RIFCSPLOWO2_01_FULL_45_24]